jgi:hypothetical protein
VTNVAGKSRVPFPAAGIMTVLIGVFGTKASEAGTWSKI